MASTFKDLQDEVLRRSTREQGGTQFTTATKNALNFALFRVAREAKWRSLRREGRFETIATYTTGSGGGTFTASSKSITVVGATFLTDDIQIGRRIKLQGDSDRHTIETITGETTLTLTKAYGGTTISGTGTYSILGQETYNLPIQSNHRVFLWHEEYGYPLLLSYMTEQAFLGRIQDNTTESIPVYYRMWGEDMVISQPKAGSVMTVSSSSTSDTSISLTVFGTVSGYPDFEIITTDSSDGTTGSAGAKVFTKVDRIVKSASSLGRLTITSDSANNTVSVLPVGDTTSGIMYSKASIYPLPNTVFPINAYYYKIPYRMVNDGDVHELGQEFDEVLIDLAVSRIDYESNKSEGDNFEVSFRRELVSLKKTNADKIDWLPTLQRGLRSRTFPTVGSRLLYSQVGSQYGPGSRF